MFFDRTFARYDNFNREWMELDEAVSFIRELMTAMNEPGTPQQNLYEE